ncbi:MAG: MATE family efflux transporter [Armatimonadota bacterium]
MNSEARHGRDLTTGSIPRHLIAFSTPILIGSAMQVAYSIINAFWVGRGLGKTAMAAITMSMPVLFVLMAVAGGLTIAANILASQSYGAKDWPRLSKVVHNSFVLTVTLSLACTFAGYFLTETLLRLAATPANVFPMAAGYLRLFFWSMPFMFIIILISALLRGVGDSKTPLYFQAASLALTAILDPLLMFGWLGVPKMGLNGTAVATVITEAGAVIALLFYLQAKRHIVALDWRRLRLDFATSALMLKVGVPSMLQQSLIAMGMFVVTKLVNGFGENSLAAAGAGLRIDMVAFMPAMTIGMAVSTLSGQNIGANRHDRVHEVFKWGLAISCGITLLVSILVMAVPGLLLHAFAKDAAVIDIGVHYLRIIAVGYIFFAIMFVGNGVINGAGHTFITTLISLVSLWAVRVPLATYMSKATGRVESIWTAMLISYAIGTVLSLAYYYSGRWRRPVTVHLLKRTDADNLEPAYPCEVEGMPSIEGKLD